MPWERVFVYRNTDMCRAQCHDTPAHIYQNYQAQIRLMVKMRFLLGLVRKITEERVTRMVDGCLARYDVPKSSA